MTDRLDEEFQLYRCADCDPEHADEGEDRGDKPYVLLVPMGEEVPDHCPRCGSYLGLCEGADSLRITNTPAERWARSQAEGQA